MGYPLPRRWPLLILTPSAGPSDPPTGGARYRRGLERTSVDEDPFYALSEWLLVGNDELERRADGQWVYRLPVLLPAGSVWLEAALWLDVIPADDFVGAFTELQRDIVRSGRARASMPQFTATRYAESVALNEQDRLWLAKGLGVLWLTKLAFGPALTGTEEEVVKKLQTLVHLPMVRAQTVSIQDVVDLSIPLEPYIFRTRSISVPLQDDQRSQVRVQWPEQPDQKVEELVATITDPAQWAKWVVCGATDPDRGSTLARALSGNKQAEPQWLGDFLTQVAAQAVHQSLAAGTNPFVNPVTLESLAAAPAEEAP